MLGTHDDESLLTVLIGSRDVTPIPDDPSPPDGRKDDPPLVDLWLDTGRDDDEEEDVEEVLVEGKSRMSLTLKPNLGVFVASFGLGLRLVLRRLILSLI